MMNKSEFKFYVKGKPLHMAKILAEENNFSIACKLIDGKSCVNCFDINSERLNVSVDNGIVMDVFGWY